MRSGAWEWCGEGVGVIHLIDRADYREGNDAMVLSLCQRAAIAYHPRHQVGPTRKKLCGICAHLLATHADGPVTAPDSSAEPV